MATIFLLIPPLQPSVLPVLLVPLLFLVETPAKHALLAPTLQQALLLVQAVLLANTQKRE